MDWRIAAIITTLSLGVYNILVQRFVKEQDWRVMIPIVFVFSLALFIYFLTSYQTFSDKISIPSTFFAFSLAFVMGISIVFTYITFKENAPLSVAVPVFNLSTLVTVILAVLFLGESINLQVALGILFSLVGMVLLLYK